MCCLTAGEDGVWRELVETSMEAAKSVKILVVPEEYQLII